MYSVMGGFQDHWVNVQNLRAFLSIFKTGLPYRSCEFHDLTKHPDTEEAMRDKRLNEGSNGK